MTSAGTRLSVLFNLIDQPKARMIRQLDLFKPDSAQEHIRDIKEQGRYRQIGPERNRENHGISVRGKYLLCDGLEPAFCCVANRPQEAGVRFEQVIFIRIRVCERSRR